jgi:hypothetical protein
MAARRRCAGEMMRATEVVMRALVATAVLFLAGCTSSAPHTMAAAAVHSGLAAGFAATERAAGGCYAVCAYGTVCNPHSGFCEPADRVIDPALAVCMPGEPCQKPGGEPAIAKTRPLGVRQPNEVIPGVGLAPTSGTVPPLPPAKSLTPVP